MTYDSGGLYIEQGDLAAFGENTARSLSGLESVSGRSCAKAVMADLGRISRCREALGAASETSGGAGEWLMDNWYLAQREGRLAAADLAAAGRLRGADGDAVICALSRALVRSGQGEINEMRCEAFLDGFQRVTILDRQELALFPAALRMALVNALAELYDGDTAGERDAAAGRLFDSLRLLGNLDISRLLEDIDKTECILRQDPAGIYGQMDERTRDMYRRQVSRLAKKTGVREYRVAMKALRLAKDGKDEKAHVGYWLFRSPMGGQERQNQGGWYIAANVLLTLFLTILAGFLTESAAAALLLLVPVSELIKRLTDIVTLRFTPPRLVPRLELADGIPASGRTLCVISAILGDRKTGRELARRLEEYRLANRDAGQNLLLGLLADLPECREPESPEDGEIMALAQEAVDELNRKYGGGFYLLARRRQYDPSSGKYTGWERKRGAILELARFLRDGEKRPNGLELLSGSMLGLRGVKYILTLDSDTRLAPGTAREMAGAMLHPLNTPVIDPKHRVVTAGHGIMHPRMAVELEAATATDFARIYAGQGGTDPYGSQVSELYQDAFDRGGFAGKGIIDVDAYLLCCGDRFPENSVLSHDALEGAFLRGAYIGDVELTDGFPPTALSWYKRANRWARGDWQNLPWLKCRSLADMDRWRLFDSVRRTLTAPMTLAALLAGFIMPSGALGTAALAALLLMLSELLTASAAALLRPESETRARYHSSIIHGVGGALLRAGVELILLPCTAWTYASAAVTALWRMCVSRKNMLSWTTAAQSDAAAIKSGILKAYAQLWFALPVGVCALIFSAAVIGKAAGAIWLFAPLCAMALGKRRTAGSEPSRREREYLLGCARDIWSYFKTFCTPEEHFLPPDNWQERPPVGVAHRTSPTNIGLCLVSALCALDLKLEKEDAAAELIGNILGTVEKLPKWNGHLYNWYDTKTALPMKPEYISAVDSGNLAACLIALACGLEEYGRKDLVLRCRSLLTEMDFRPLYDERRRLFHIGLDPVTGKASRSWYDLLASEARLTGYVAIARGDVERRHWRRLSRALVQKDGFRGLVSWTGTMFEYLMPQLFLPCCRDSLLYESARFCLYVQKRRVRPGRPWGVSESAYYSLDPLLSYRYKAHGCAGLALKRGMDAELVVSPYSSFLALDVDRAAAVRNLRRLEEKGMCGRFGFWEAADFTPARSSDSEFAAVRCVMAHHLGMSIAAINNCLNDGACRRRFMRDPAMSAFRGLLEEKVPVGGLVLKRDGLQPPEQRPRPVPQLWRRTGGAVNFEAPVCAMLSNGIYSVTATESGMCFARSGGVLPYAAGPGPLDGRGVTLRLHGREKSMELLPKPGADAGFSWDFTMSEARIMSASKNARCETALSLSPDSPGELRRISIAQSAGAFSELRMNFAPVLAFSGDYAAHPAFYRLGLQAYSYQGALMIKRVPNGRTGGGYLCLASDREFQASSGGKTPPVWLLYDPVELVWQIPAEGMSLRIAMCMGSSEQDAYSGAQRMLAQGECSAFPAAYASLLGMDARETALAADICPLLLFPKAPGGGTAKHELWRSGISGDLPVIAADVTGENGPELAGRLIRCHGLLSVCGMTADLALITGDGGSYDRPMGAHITAQLQKLGLEASLGQRGGVHAVDTAEAKVLLRAANVIIGPDGAVKPERTMSNGNYITVNRNTARPNAASGYKFRDDGAFTLVTGGGLPPRAWGHMLTNGRLGYFAAERGAGFMWYKNAREGRITPWENDPEAENGPESLRLELNGERHSLFAANDGLPARVTFEFGAAVWEKRIGGTAVKLTAFVPPEMAARVLIIETAGEPLPEDARLEWTLELCLAPDRKEACFTSVELEGSAISASNPRFPYPGAQFTAVFSPAPSGMTGDKYSAARGAFDGRGGPGLSPCFGVSLPARGGAVIVCGVEPKEKLALLAEPEAAYRSLQRTKNAWLNVRRLTVRTPSPELDHYLSGWGVYQALACRVLGRTSMYQSGGAVGFRDQLQDAVNLIAAEPGLARSQILQSCRHQFAEGDVLHWWHMLPDGDHGVRTRCSDDLVWLPWAICEYAEKTGDTALCDETAPWLTAPVLADGENDRYAVFPQSERESTVLEHGLAALEAAFGRGTGPHGLPLFGSGDWNDGMSAVGGESVWLGWFLSDTARRFAGLCRGLGRDPGALEARAAAMGKAANDAWDGAWYLRGWFSSGEALGASGSPACEIDSIAQSFGAMSEYSDKKRAAAALDSALQRLFDRKNGIVRLFTPAFEQVGPDPGYIRGYGPGFRENGGQYTHGAIWLAQALLRSGRARDGLDVLLTLLPESREPAIYKGEPYVLAADVYANPDHVGEAGWTWYTGSAAWFWRVAAEELLGLRLMGGKLYIRPNLPEDWSGYDAVLTKPNGEKTEISVNLDGVFVNGKLWDGRGLEI